MFALLHRLDNKLDRVSDLLDEHSEILSRLDKVAEPQIVRVPVRMLMHCG